MTTEEQAMAFYRRAMAHYVHCQCPSGHPCTLSNMADAFVGELGLTGKDIRELERELNPDHRVIQDTSGWNSRTW